MTTAEENVYVEMVERLIDPNLRDAAEGILVGSMMMALRRKIGEQPAAVYDCLDQKLTAALRTLRERAKKFDEFDGSGWRN
jgi:hypothetical protein